MKSGRASAQPARELTGDDGVELGEILGVLLLVLGELLVPGRLRLGTLAVQSMYGRHLLGDLEGLVLPAEVLTGRLGLVGAEGRAMDVVGVGLVGGAVADEGGHLDEGGAGIGLGLVDRVADGVEVGVTVLDVLDVPAVRLVAGADILGEGDVGVAVDGDGVVIVEGDELAESPVGGEGGALTGHTLHVAAVTHDGVGVVVDDLAVGLVEAARMRCLPAIREPTALQMPIPRGPVVTSMPLVMKFSG